MLLNTGLPGLIETHAVIKGRSRLKSVSRLLSTCRLLVQIRLSFVSIAYTPFVFASFYTMLNINFFSINAKCILKVHGYCCFCFPLPLLFLETRLSLSVIQINTCVEVTCTCVRMCYVKSVA